MCHGDFYRKFVLVCSNTAKFTDLINVGYIGNETKMWLGLHDRRVHVFKGSWRK